MQTHRNLMTLKICVTHMLHFVAFVKVLNSQMGKLVEWLDKYVPFFSQHLRSFSTVAFHNRIFTTCKCIHLAFVQTMHQRFFAASRFGPWETGTFETDVKFDRKKKSKTRGGKKRHIMSSTSSSKYQMSLTYVETVEFVLKYS